MSLYFESLKPINSECTIEKWRENAKQMRQMLEGKDEECRNIRNQSRKIRYDTAVKKAWDLYLNNIKLHDRAYEIQVYITDAEDMLPKIAKEKKLIEEDKFEIENILQSIDKWIVGNMEGLSLLDRKLENEITRNDDGILETKKEIKLLEELKNSLKNMSLQAWDRLNKLEEIETQLDLNLEFKREVLKMELRCQAIQKKDTGVSFKVEPTKGPKKMLTLEEWTKTVYSLVEKGKNEIHESVKQRQRINGLRDIALNEYAIQFDKTDYAMRKRIYEINREKNERQFQMIKVQNMMEITKAECRRLENFLKEVKEDLQCAETRCSERFFRPYDDATIDPPFTGINKEVKDLQAKVEEIEGHIDVLKTFYNKLESDEREIFLDTERKNKALQNQVQALDMRISGRYDPKKIYAYNRDALLSKLERQLPPPFVLYSNKC